MPALAHSILLSLFSLTPLLFLCRDKVWKSLTWPDKAVAATLACWSVAIVFSLHMGVQFFAAFAVAAIVSASRYRRFSVPAPYFYLFFLYFAWHVISLAWTPCPADGLRNLKKYALFALVPMAFCCVRLRRDTLYAILKGFFYTMCLYTLACLVCWAYQCVTYSIPFGDWFHITKWSYNGIRSFDLLYAWSNYHHPTYNGISLLLAFAVGLRGPYRHWLKIAYGAGSLLVIMLSQSRISLVLWFIMLFFFWFWRLRNITPWNYIYSSVLTVMAGVVLLFGRGMVEDFFYDPVRNQNAATAWHCVRMHPWLGSGIEGMRYEMDSDEIAREIGYEAANRHLANPHYQFLGDWMQTGLPGMALSLALVAGCCAYAARERKGLLQYFLLIMILVMHIEMPFYLYKGILYFTLFSGLLTVAEGKAPEVAPGSGRTNK